MTTWPQIAVTQDSTLLRQSATDLLTGMEPMLLYTGPPGPAGQVSRFSLDGPTAGWPGIQDTISLTGGVKGLTAPFKHIDLKPARTSGVIYNGTVFDPLVMDLQLQAHANTPQGLSKIWSEWVGAWDPEKLGKFEYITFDRGYWYFPARLDKPWPDQDKKSPRLLKVRDVTHSMRCDLAFWAGMPYVDTFKSAGGSGFLKLANIGSQPGWPTIICYAGTSDGASFSFSNGSGSTVMITLGPLKAGQVILINTYPALRGVVDLTSTPQSPQQLNGLQTLLEIITNFSTNNNPPPLLQWFESLFGILPIQSPVYSLLNGRLSNPIPGVAQPSWATMSPLAVTITNGNSGSQMIGRIDPLRRSPE